MRATISKLPFIGTPVDRVLQVHEVYTTVYPPKPDIVSEVVPLWVVILSAVAGAIILLLLIFLLHKVITIFFVKIELIFNLKDDYKVL